jgi:polysaccharide biosynthesis/export protein
MGDGGVADQTGRHILMTKTRPPLPEQPIGPPTALIRLFTVLTTALAVCGIVAFSGCSPGAPPPATAPAPPAPAASVSSAEPYRIQPGDVLGVRLLLNPDLNEEIVVRPDGHVSTTVVSDEVAAGRTVAEVTTALTRDYTSILRNPRLTVVLKTFSPTRIYVGGEVARPGESVTVGLIPTLSQAIARAGGLKRGAGDRVFIIRRGAGDEPQISSARLRDVMRKHEPGAPDSEADARLEPFDVVYVPRNGTAEVHRFVDERLVQLVPEIWGFSYNVKPNSAAAARGP